MAHQTGVDVDKLALAGPGLSFIVYPEALSIMPFPWAWCILFFLMMVLIGFGSILSLVECVLDSVIEKCRHIINTNSKDILVRFLICIVFYLLGLSMTFSVFFCLYFAQIILNTLI
jgi:SNF family Na+-dependent transporter